MWKKDHKDYLLELFMDKIEKLEVKEKQSEKEVEDRSIMSKSREKEEIGNIDNDAVKAERKEEEIKREGLEAIR